MPSSPEVKFCGLTRPEDAALAAALGASYVGVIFAGGPRVLTAARAREVLDAAATPAAGAAAPRRVGVFGAVPPADVAAIAADAALDVAQLHGDPDAAAVDAVRRVFGGELWAVARSAGDAVPSGMAELFAAADAVVLDARVAGGLGGTGVALPWEALAAAVDAARGAGGRLVLAGGLTPDNVARAAAALAPDVVDVSSGVEASPGVKDHARMRAFAAAARAAVPEHRGGSSS
ncbi:MAG: N-(5'-phosphoribosyl)anthranilate isomerase [Gemmatimonadaceae bacterium]